MTFQITRAIVVNAITRDSHLKGSASHLRPVELTFKITLSCYMLDRHNYVVNPPDMLNLAYTIMSTFNNKIIIAETDEWLDELSSLAGLGITDVVVFPSTTMESWCAAAKAESERWLFEQQYNSRVWLERIEVECDDCKAAIQVNA